MRVSATRWMDGWLDEFCGVQRIVLYQFHDASIVIVIVIVIAIVVELVERMNESKSSLARRRENPHPE